MQKAQKKEPYADDIAAIKAMALVADAEIEVVKNEARKETITYLTVTTKEGMLFHTEQPGKPLAPYQFRIALECDRDDKRVVDVERWVPSWKYLNIKDYDENPHPTWYPGRAAYSVVCMGAYDYQDYRPAREKSLKDAVGVCLYVLQTIEGNYYD